MNEVMAAISRGRGFGDSSPIALTERPIPQDELSTVRLSDPALEHLARA
jgi:hypothetical protein